MKHFCGASSKWVIWFVRYFVSFTNEVRVALQGPFNSTLIESFACLRSHSDLLQAQFNLPSFLAFPFLGQNVYHHLLFLSRGLVWNLFLKKKNVSYSMAIKAFFLWVKRPALKANNLQLPIRIIGDARLHLAYASWRGQGQQFTLSWLVFIHVTTVDRGGLIKKDSC